MYYVSGADVPQVGPKSWSEYSTDQFTIPVIGVMSRDGAYVAAIVNDSARQMSQAWHDCIHNNGEWAPAEAAPQDQRWRVRIYALEGGQKELMDRVEKDWGLDVRGCESEHALPPSCLGAEEELKEPSECEESAVKAFSYGFHSVSDT